MEEEFNNWLSQVRSELDSINMPLDRWQKAWPFDFEESFRAGIGAREAANRANMFWWRKQNEAIGQDCRKAPSCWLPNGHEGSCVPFRQE